MSAKRRNTRQAETRSPALVRQALRTLRFALHRGFGLPERVWTSVRRQGLAATIRYYSRRVLTLVRPRGVSVLGPGKARPSAFDSAFGVDTDGKIPLRKLTIHSRDDVYGFPYQATDPETFDRAIAHLDIQHQDFIFVDFGAGKGRVLLMASGFPFKRIIGVEFSPELVATARYNVARYSEAG